MIIKQLSHNYKFDPFHAFNFIPYEEDLKGITLYYGIFSEKLVTKDDTNIKVLFFVEWPNCLYGKAFDIAFIVDNFDYIFSICPYTNKFLNMKYKVNKFKDIFFPVELEKLPVIKENKPISLIYTGHNITQVTPIRMIYEILDKTIGISTYAQLIAPMQQPSIHGYYEKMKLLSDTKIALIHNVLQPLKTLYAGDPLFSDQIANTYLPWHNIEGDKEVPQIKSRMFEASIMKCIMLVYKDEYNLIESYYSEGADFIYFSSVEEALNIIVSVLNDYDKYKHIAENAYKKTLEKYTTKAFIKYIGQTIKLERDLP
jgi:hypothetical protein